MGLQFKVLNVTQTNLMLELFTKEDDKQKNNTYGDISWISNLYIQIKI